VFTLILMETHRTDKAPRSLHLSRGRLAWVIAAIIGLPLIGFALGMLLFAPLFLNEEAQTARRDADDAQIELRTLRQTEEDLLVQVVRLQEQLNAEQQARATAEARITIAETARAEAINRLQSLEGEVLQLGQRNAFFESFMTPQVDLDVLQCFNISAREEGNRVRYGVNFMKNDQSDRTRIAATVQFRVRTGEALLNDSLNAEQRAETELPILHTVDIAMTKDVRTTGSFEAELPDEGLKILDIRAIDAEGNALAHCWKDL